MNALRVAVVGGGWAGMAAAVAATRAGHHVTLLEAAREWGGRARALPLTLMDGSSLQLDNGQHILVGAYTDTLALMRSVGVDPHTALLRLPLCMQYPDGSGLVQPDWPVPWDVLAGIACARGWSLADKWSLLRTTGHWQRSGFRCSSHTSVAALCQGLSATVLRSLIEPLCISALNTPPQRASAQVFLRVLQDALLGERGSSNLLIPRTDLGSLLPRAAAHWLQRQGATVRLGARVQELAPAQRGDAGGTGWQLDGQEFDAVLWATGPSVAAQLLGQASGPAAPMLRAWAAQAGALRFEGIATVYAQARGCRLPRPMLALASNVWAPAQFVFDRGQLGGPAGLLAFVVSACQLDRSALQAQVLQQARDQLGRWLDAEALVALQTVVEKRATFACTPALVRPPQAVAPGLWACGDYVDGPYPATLEGAVRSGLQAARALAAPP